MIAKGDGGSAEHERLGERFVDWAGSAIPMLLRFLIVRFRMGLHEAEDIVLETILVICHKIKILPPEELLPILESQEKFDGYLRGIARHLAFARFRQQARDRKLLDWLKYRFCEAVDPSQLFEPSIAHLERVLEECDAIDRMIVELLHKGLTQKEVASRVNVHRATVRRRLDRIATLLANGD